MDPKNKKKNPKPGKGLRINEKEEQELYIRI
jgi:hypothetical protein